MSSLVMILFILLAYTLDNVWKCLENIDFSHYWELEGLSMERLMHLRAVVLQLSSS